MAEQFPPLSGSDAAAAANQVGAWLAQDDLATLPALPQVDVVVLAGNAVIPTIDAACRLAGERRRLPLLISGGVGHSTGYSLRGGAPGSRYRRLPGGWPPGSACSRPTLLMTTGTSPISRLVVEDQSSQLRVRTPVFTPDHAGEPGLAHRRGIVIQDPTIAAANRDQLPSPASGGGDDARRSG